MRREGGSPQLYPPPLPQPAFQPCFPELLSPVKHTEDDIGQRRFENTSFKLRGNRRDAGDTLPLRKVSVQSEPYLPKLFVL